MCIYICLNIRNPLYCTKDTCGHNIYFIITEQTLIWTSGLIMHTQNLKRRLMGNVDNGDDVIASVVLRHKKHPS